ncbi:hypothetical protein EON65_09280, partial [archaeon]
MLFTYLHRVPFTVHHKPFTITPYTIHHTPHTLYQTLKSGKHSNAAKNPVDMTEEEKQATGTSTV